MTVPDGTPGTLRPATDLVRSRCFRHPRREAVARCPACTRVYCRECVTEHEGRVICATCLAQLTLESTDRPRRVRKVLQALYLSCSLLFLWLVFFVMGRLLLMIPSDFHEGSLWRADSAGEARPYE